VKRNQLEINSTTNKITTQRREKGGWFDLEAGVYNNEEVKHGFSQLM
jgi:hypothetical protein